MTTAAFALALLACFALSHCAKPECLTSITMTAYMNSVAVSKGTPY